jgi:choline dehydrogenase-like flavoprotein
VTQYAFASRNAAGASGPVLAARLSEDRDRQVLLVEAGPETMRWASRHSVAKQGGTCSLVGRAQRPRLAWRASASSGGSIVSRLYWR